jgi:hypothetical protein
MAKIIYKDDAPFEVITDDGSVYGMLPHEGTLGEDETEAIFEAEDGNTYLVQFEGSEIGGEEDRVWLLTPIQTEVEELDELAPEQKEEDEEAEKLV